jgi:serine phosphatase RsbU (regulator of sigma subunit)
MDAFLLSPSAIRNLPILILNVLLAIYLLRGYRRSRATALLALWMGSLAVAFLAILLSRTVYDNPVVSFIANWQVATLAGLAGTVVLLAFAYTFPRNPYPREARTVLTVAGLVAAGLGVLLLAGIPASPASYWYEFRRFVWTPHELGLGNVLYPLVLPVGYLWSLVVLVRKTLALGRDGRPVWARLWRPGTPDAVAARSFALLLVAAVLVSVLDTLSTAGVVPSAAFTTAYLVTFLGFALAYINNAPEPSSFRVKIIGVSLVTILVVLGLVAEVTLAEAERAYDQEHQAEVAHIGTLLATGNLAAVDARVAYVAVLPASGPPAPVLVRDPALPPPALLAQDSVVAGPRRYRGTNAPVGGQYTAYAVTVGGQTYEVGYPYLEYRRALDATGRQLVAVMLGATVAILAGFSLFFQVSLIRPLEALLAGVTQVNAGRLDVAVPVRVEDEIGFLARSFNGMVRSLAAARDTLAAQERLQSELDIARGIQQRLLPRQLPHLAGFDLAAVCRPARETSGDSYDLLLDGQGHLHLVVADACGKSVPAALLIALSRNPLRAALARTGDPAGALSETNRLLASDLAAHQFVAVACATLDPAGRALHLANAGQVYPALVRAGAGDGPPTCTFLETPGPRLPLGLVPNLTYEALDVALQPGDLLVCYSDGLVEATNPAGEPYGFDRLASLLCGLGAYMTPASDTLNRILAAVTAWAAGDPHPDDITLVVVRAGIAEPAAQPPSVTL